jgi:hypothetical protein
MPANTPKGYPYPLGTDRVMDGDDAIHSLATAIDTKLGVAASGRYTAADAASAGAVQTTVVTFPVGLFTAAPVVMIVNETTNPTDIFTSVALNSTTTSSSSLRSLRKASVAGVPCAWLAVQVG